MIDHINNLLILATTRQTPPLTLAIILHSSVTSPRMRWRKIVFKLKKVKLETTQVGAPVCMVRKYDPDYYV